MVSRWGRSALTWPNSDSIQAWSVGVPGRPKCWWMAHKAMNSPGRARGHLWAVEFLTVVKGCEAVHAPVGAGVALERLATLCLARSSRLGGRWVVVTNDEQRGSRVGCGSAGPRWLVPGAA